MSGACLASLARLSLIKKMTDRITESQFIISGGAVTDLPISELPEVAFIGRSNAGKSTLLNRLTGRRGLAKTSSKPGKTQTVNLFKIDTKLAGDKRASFHCVDLPGYGYAKLSKKQRFSMTNLVIDYFEQRDSLDLVFLLSDAKRKLNDEDVELYQFIRECDRSVNVVLTKIDKLNQKERNKSIKTNAAILGLERGDLYLAGSNRSTDPILDRIEVLL